MFSAAAPSEHNIWILRRFPSDHQLASQFKQWAKNDWLVQKKKSLFRSLCSTFNDLEKFNELKTHTYIILFHLIFLKIYSPTVQFSCSKTIWNWLRKKQLETTAQSFWYHSTDVSLPIPMILQKCWFVVWVFEK